MHAYFAVQCLWLFSQCYACVLADMSFFVFSDHECSVHVECVLLLLKNVRFISLQI